MLLLCHYKIVPQVNRGCLKDKGFKEGVAGWVRENREGGVKGGARGGWSASRSGNKNGLIMLI